MLPSQKCPLTAFCTLPPFYHTCVTVSCTLSSRFFPRFADARVPVKVLKVGWSISACRVACGEVYWYKANFRL